MERSLDEQLGEKKKTTEKTVKEQIVEVMKVKGWERLHFSTR